MPANARAELQEFHRFIGERLKQTEVDWSPEEALDQWRRLHADPKSADEELAAIQEALHDMAKGDRGIPFDEFYRDFRARHDLPDPS
jgi:hypothetical protein